MTLVGNGTHYTDNTVSNGQTYYYKVSAMNGVGEGQLSNEASGAPTNATNSNNAKTPGLDASSILIVIVISILLFSIIRSRKRRGI